MWSAQTDIRGKWLPWFCTELFRTPQTYVRAQPRDSYYCHSGAVLLSDRIVMAKNSSSRTRNVASSILGSQVSGRCLRTNMVGFVLQAYLHNSCWFWVWRLSQSWHACFPLRCSFQMSSLKQLIAVWTSRRYQLFSPSWNATAVPRDSTLRSVRDI